jgi:hypothetical protein
MTDSSRPRPKTVKVSTDESGFMKTVEADGRLIPGVYSVSIYAEAKTQLAEVTLEITPAVIDVTGKIGSVIMECPICVHRHEHICYEGPTESQYDEKEHGGA